MLVGQILLVCFATTVENKLFSVAVENKQMLFLNVSGMHHHKDTCLGFIAVSAWVCVDLGTLSAELPPPPHPMLLLTHCYTAPESAACQHYSHTHLPLLVPPQHLEPGTRGGSSRHPRAEPGGVFFTHVSRHTRTRTVTIIQLIDWLDDRK